MLKSAIRRFPPIWPLTTASGKTRCKLIFFLSNFLVFSTVLLKKTYRISCKIYYADNLMQDFTGEIITDANTLLRLIDYR